MKANVCAKAMLVFLSSIKVQSNLDNVECNRGRNHEEMYALL